MGREVVIRRWWGYASFNDCCYQCHKRVFWRNCPEQRFRDLYSTKVKKERHAKGTKELIFKLTTECKPSFKTKATTVWSNRLMRQEDWSRDGLWSESIRLASSQNQIHDWNFPNSSIKRTSERERNHRNSTKTYNQTKLPLIVGLIIGSTHFSVPWTQTSFRTYLKVLAIKCAPQNRRLLRSGSRSALVCQWPRQWRTSRRSQSQRGCSAPPPIDTNRNFSSLAIHTAKHHWYNIIKICSERWPKYTTDMRGKT